MPSTKISELTAMTTAAAGDLLVAVDIADTTMAPSGTDKKITAGELLTSGLPAEFSTFDGPGGSGLVGFGGSTASYPALKRSGTELQVRLADDSAFAAFSANSVYCESGLLNAGSYNILRNAAGFDLVHYQNKLYENVTGAGLQLGNGSSSGISAIYFGEAYGTQYTALIPKVAALELRDSTVAQTFRVYGTYTDASNYVRASLGATSTAVTLAAETAGTGADNINLILSPAGTGRVKVGTNAFCVSFDKNDFSANFPFTALDGGYALGIGTPSSPAVGIRDGADYGLIAQNIRAVEGGLIGWGPAVCTATMSATDTAFRRVSARVVEIDNGTLGTYGDLVLRTLCVRSTAAPGSPVNGDLWLDTTQKTLSYYAAGVNQTVNGVLFTQTDTITVANTVTETALTGTGIGTLTLPANFFTAGKTIKIRALGYHSSTASPDITLRFKLGSTTVLTTGTISSGNATDESWICDACLTCRTTGATGTVIGQGYYDELHGVGSTGGMVNTAATTIDTTASQAISLTVEWGTANAGNTISCTNLVIEIIN